MEVWQAYALLAIMLFTLTGLFYTRFLPRDLTLFIGALLTPFIGVFSSTEIFASLVNWVTFCLFCVLFFFQIIRQKKIQHMRWDILFFAFGVSMWKTILQKAHLWLIFRSSF